MTGQWRDKGRVLVVGTTDDYIDWIRRARPGQALFLTAPAVRSASAFESPRSKEEILVDLKETGPARAAVADHLARFGLSLAGIACFDCERLGLSADLAKAFGLTFPGRKAIDNARDKVRSKEIWRAHGVSCPETAGINRLEDALDFMAFTRGPIVLKPVSGSGSELVFKCRTPEDCADGFGAIREGLARRADNPLFQKSRGDLMLAEEMIQGTEFSADFIVDGIKAMIIRVCRKIKYRSHPFGTIAGYQLLADPESVLDMAGLKETLFRGAASLGITQGICMVDFIRNREGQNVLIEMTPRPGGDCLPQLIREAMGLDMLGLALDVAGAISPVLEGIKPGRDLIGLRIFAPGAGVLKRVDFDSLAEDPRVRSIVINRPVGHVIAMPPEDYDSWLLGHYILEPSGPGFPETLSRVTASRIHVEVA